MVWVFLLDCMHDWFVRAARLNVAVVLIPNIICTKGFTTYDSTFFDEDYLRLYGGAWDAVS